MLPKKVKVIDSPKSRAFRPVSAASSGASSPNDQNPIPAVNWVSEAAARTGRAREVMAQLTIPGWKANRDADTLLTISGA